MGCPSQRAVFAGIFLLLGSFASQAAVGGVSRGPLPIRKVGSHQSATDEQPGGLERVRSLLKEGKITEADHATREFLDKHADSADGHFLLGYILFREIQTEAAGKGAIRYDPDASEARFREANARASLAEFTEGAKHRDPSPFDLKIVALDYVLLDDPSDADKWMSKSVERNPADSDAWYNLGRTKYTENRFEEAIRAFEQCLKLDPKNVKAEDNLGLSYYGLGRADDALAAYKTAIEWESQGASKDPEPFIDLGTLYLEQNRPKGALPYLLEATRIAPGDAKGHEKLGKTFLQMEDLPKAQSELEKAVALAPHVASLHYMLGQVYRKEGFMDKAKIEFDRTAELNGAHSSSLKLVP